MVLIACTALAFGVIAGCTVPVFFWKRSKQNNHQPELHALLNGHALSAQSSQIANRQELSGVESDGSSEIEIKISGLSRTKLMRAVGSGQQMQPSKTVVSDLIVAENRGSTSTPLSNTARADASDPLIDEVERSKSVRSSQCKKVQTRKPSSSKKPQPKKNKVFGSATSQHFRRDRDQLSQSGPSQHPAVKTPTPGTSKMSNGEVAQSSSSRYNASRPRTPRQRKLSSTQLFQNRDLWNLVRRGESTLSRMEEVEEDSVHHEEHLSPIEKDLSPLSLPLLHETTPLSSRMETCVQSGAESDSSSVLNIKITGMSRSKLWNLMARNPATKPKRIISSESPSAETPVSQSSNSESTPNQALPTEIRLSPCQMEESLKSSLQLDIEDWETGSDNVPGCDSDKSEATTKGAEAESDETIFPEGFARKLGQNQRGMGDIIARSKTREEEVSSSQATGSTQMRSQQSSMPPARETHEIPSSQNSLPEPAHLPRTSNVKSPIHNQQVDILNVGTPEPDKPPSVSNVVTPEHIHRSNTSDFKTSEPDEPLTVSTVKIPEPEQLTKISKVEAPEPTMDECSHLHAVPSTSSNQSPARRMSKHERQHPDEKHHKLWRAMAGTAKYI